MSTEQKSNDFVIEARLRFRYQSPTEGRMTIHKRATYRGEKGEEVCTGGGQIYSTGRGGGPGIEIKFLDWTIIQPNADGDNPVLRYLRTQATAEERASIEFRKRPALVPDAMLLDEGIRTLTAEEYVAECRREHGIATDETGTKRGPGRPRKGTR